MDETETIRQAAQNNASWCAALCATHGCAGRWSALAWTHPVPTPRYYPNAVTLGASAKEATSLIDKLYATRPVGAWSIKDSYAALELSSRGWHILFTAQWLLHAAPSTAVEDVAGWRVDDAASLALWEQAQQRATGDAQGPRTFLPGLLADEHAAVLSLGTKSNDINAGVIAYRAAGMVGLTNLFTPRGERGNRYADAVQVAARTFPGLPIVSYAHGNVLRAARAAGFACIGPLHVWTRDAR